MGKPTSGSRRLQMLNDLTKHDGYATRKRPADDRKRWRYIGMQSGTCSTAED